MLPNHNDVMLTCTLFCLFLGEDGPMWMVPVNVSSSEDSNSVKASVLLDTRKVHINIGSISNGHWVKVRFGGAAAINYNCA